MEGSTVVGFMAVLAVSGSVALLNLQVHKRLLSEFMKKIELELGGKVKCRPKKKVQFAKDVVKASWNDKEHHYGQHSRLILAKDIRVMVTTNDNASPNHKDHDQLLVDNMPPNRRALYKGIMDYKALIKAKGYSVHGFRNGKSWLSPS